MLRDVMGFRYNGRVLLRRLGDGAPWDGIVGPAVGVESDKEAMARVFKDRTGIDTPAAGWIKIAQMYGEDKILTILVSHGGFDGLKPDKAGGDLVALGYVPPDAGATAAWVAGMLLDHTLAYITVNFDRSDD